MGKSSRTNLHYYSSGTRYNRSPLAIAESFGASVDRKINTVTSERFIPVIPQEVHAILERYLQLADAALPGRIEGLYLVGSVALGDFQPGKSDVDFLAVTRHVFTTEELDQLDAVHQTLGAAFPRPWFDGVYVTWDHLERSPEVVGAAPSTHEGKLDRSGGFEANPSVWLTLRNHPLAVRGPSTPRLWYDLQAIRRWNVENLNTYWAGLLARGRSAAARATMRASEWRLDEAIAWCVPGVARLHYTITAGDVTSKSGACHYALGAFSQRWHPIIREALALRAGADDEGRGRKRSARWRDTLDFMQLVIGDANAQYSG
jgi:hypothetical protein